MFLTNLSVCQRQGFNHEDFLFDLLKKKGAGGIKGEGCSTMFDMWYLNCQTEYLDVAPGSRPPVLSLINGLFFLTDNSLEGKSFRPVVNRQTAKVLFIHHRLRLKVHMSSHDRQTSSGCVTGSFKFLLCVVPSVCQRALSLGQRDFFSSLKDNPVHRIGSLLARFHRTSSNCMPGLARNEDRHCFQRSARQVQDRCT